MKLNFIIKTGTSKLILIFPGWSCSPGLYKDLSFEGWDIAVVDDFSVYELEDESIRRYPTVYVMAWSLGVYWAEKSGISPMVTSAFAINGSVFPAHDYFGIPVNIFQGTADGLSLRNLQKFRRRMAGSAEVYQNVFAHQSETPDEIEGLRRQLYRIRGEAPDSLEILPSDAINLPWRRAYISEHDAIFPPDSLKRFWSQTGVETVSMAEPHFIDMASLIRHSIPEVSRIADRFSEAAATYEKEAVVQKKMAADLGRMLMDSFSRHGGRFLEIGAGTGLFTAQYVEVCRPSQIDFVDISSVRPDLRRAGAETINHRFHIADAEEWIADCGISFDAIVSSAAVQWFSNLPNFLKECRNHLAEDGILAFSTFLPGNLAELDSIRPVPLKYLSAEEISSVLRNLFAEVTYLEDSVTLEFSDCRQLLRHLQHTGVAGSEGSGRNLWKLRNLRSLTFRYGCFAAKKPFTDKPEAAKKNKF